MYLRVNISLIQCNPNSIEIDGSPFLAIISNIMDSTVCRVCFITNVKLHRIADIGLQGLYEVIACTELDIEDGSPKTICYMCCSQLQRCNRFFKMVQTAENFLAELANMMVTTEYTDLTNEEMMHNLSISPVKCHSMDDQIEVSIPIKEEIEDKKPSLVEMLHEIPIKIEQTEDEHLSIARGVKHAESHAQNQRFSNRNICNNTNEAYNCHLCDKSYTTKHSLLIHMGKAHDTTNRNSYSYNISDPDNKPFTCKDCNKKFKTFSYFKIHSRIHTGTRPFACSHCNKTFNQNRALNTHMKIHSGDKSHACYCCGKTFFRRDNLETHMRHHTGDRPFSCNECDKTFYGGIALKRHMAIHNRDKAYTCSLCDKTFNQNKYLHTHMITHSNEKPHVCQLCKKAFRRKNDLKMHMLSHTGNKSFACKLCGKAFVHNHHLQRHVKTHSK